MQSFQQAVRDVETLAWPQDQPGQHLSDALIARLAEETGELARAVRRFGRDRWGHPGELPGTRHEVSEELGDVLFLVARIGNLCGVHLNDAAVQVIEKLSRRWRQAQGE